jgi:hypothetical protein
MESAKNFELFSRIVEGAVEVPTVVSRLEISEEMSSAEIAARFIRYWGQCADMDCEDCPELSQCKCVVMDLANLLEWVSEE